ncbi:MAG: hypothetical protein V3U27_02295, partial [Candidatus Tectomicrobia bacterium]
MSLILGSFFQYTNVDETSVRFVNQPQAGISDNTFDVQTFVGVDAELILDTRDNAVNPKQGFYWTNEAQLNV